MPVRRSGSDRARIQLGQERDVCGYHGQGSAESSLVGGKVIVELRWVSTERSQHAIHSPGFPLVLPLVNLRVMVHPPHLSCGAENSTTPLALTSGKEGALKEG